LQQSLQRYKSFRSFVKGRDTNAPTTSGDETRYSVPIATEILRISANQQTRCSPSRTETLPNTSSSGSRSSGSDGSRSGSSKSRSVAGC
jgi:hypothetical protein